MLGRQVEPKLARNSSELDSNHWQGFGKISDIFGSRKFSFIMGVSTCIFCTHEQDSRDLYPSHMLPKKVARAPINDATELNNVLLESEYEQRKYL